MAKTSAERVAEHRAKNKGLEAAKAKGRAYGEDEANRRGEVDDERAGRIRRAENYAVWEFNGKPMNGKPLSVSEFIAKGA